MKRKTTSIDRSNCFDLLRLIAAVLVVFSHCYALKGMRVDEPLRHAVDVVGFGSLGVLAFFAISGYLVTLSWMRDPNILPFLSRRLLRIVPALAFVTVLAGFVLGPIVSEWPVGQYFQSSDTWAYLLNIFVYTVHYHLPGVFVNNPHPFAMNGSIWTLRLEFSFYIIVTVLAFAHLLRWRFSGLTLALLFAVFYTALIYVPQLQDILAHKQFMLTARNGLGFFMGMFFAQNYQPKKWPLPLVVGGWCLAAFLLFTPYCAGLALLLGSAVCVATGQSIRVDLTKFGDYSYGIYVWGFVVQQTLVWKYPQIDIPTYFVASFAITCACAGVSWWLIEKPCLKLKPLAAAKAQILENDITSIAAQTK